MSDLYVFSYCSCCRHSTRIGTRPTLKRHKRYVTAIPSPSLPPSLPPSLSLSHLIKSFIGGLRPFDSIFLLKTKIWFKRTFAVCSPFKKYMYYLTNCIPSNFWSISTWRAFLAISINVYELKS